MKDSPKSKNKDLADNLLKQTLELEFPNCSGMIQKHAKVSHMEMAEVSEWYLPASKLVRKKSDLLSALRNNSKPFEL